MPCTSLPPLISTLSLPEYASTLSQARKMGSIASMIPGVGQADATALLRLYENIIR